MTGMTIVCGLPGTGKSTFAAVLARSIGALHLNTDRIRREMGKQGQYSLAIKSAVYNNLLLRTREALKAGKNVIVDGTFYKQEIRKPFNQLADDLNVPVYWIEMLASDDTIRERVGKSRPFSEADYQVYLKVKNDYDPLHPQHLALDSDILDMDEMIELAKEFMQRKNQVSPITSSYGAR